MKALKDFFHAGVCGNGLRYMSEYVLWHQEQGTLTEEMRRQFHDLVIDCMVLPGLLQRNPVYLTNLTDQEAHDDYVSVVNASKQLGLHLHDMIYEWGKNHPIDVSGIKFYGVFNNRDWPNITPSAWLWRMPHVRAHMEYACDVEPSIFRKLVWFFVVLFGGRKESDDSWALNWHLVGTGGQKSWYNKLASKVFMWRFKRAHPELIKEVSREWT